MLLGGAQSASFSAIMNTLTHTMGDLGWRSTDHEPDMRMWDAAHPLAAGLNASVVFQNPGLGRYVARISDQTMRVAFRNSDGFPILMSKVVGNASGLFVYAAFSPEQVLANNTEDVAVLENVLDNALGLTAEAASPPPRPVLLVETIDESSASSARDFEQLEAVLLSGGHPFDVIVAGSDTALSLDGYDSVVMSVAYLGSPPITAGASFALLNHMRKEAHLHTQSTRSKCGKYVCISLVFFS